MSGMSRRDLLRASATAAAVAVPMSALGSQVAGAATVAERGPGTADAAAHGASAVTTTADLVGPVMFSVLDADRGEVSILHGTSEVIVRDRQLVERIMRAARRAV